MPRDRLIQSWSSTPSQLRKVTAGQNTGHPITSQITSSNTRQSQCSRYMLLYSFRKYCNNNNSKKDELRKRRKKKPTNQPTNKQTVESLAVGRGGGTYVKLLLKRGNFDSYWFTADGTFISVTAVPYTAEVSRV